MGVRPVGSSSLLNITLITQIQSSFSVDLCFRKFSEPESAVVHAEVKPPTPDPGPECAVVRADGRVVLSVLCKLSGA